MDKLQEIFKDNQELLQIKEVKELIDYCKTEYKRIFEAYKKLYKFESFVLDKCMNSNVIVKKGNNCYWTIEKIIEYIAEEGGMFSANKLEQAYREGLSDNYNAIDDFDIENYR